MNAMPASSQEDADTPPSALSPSWGRPRSPLPPDKLAKLANALGVSTPVPLINAYASPSAYAPSPIVPPSAASPSFDFRRSPTPSASSSAHTYTPATQTSKFLLHVVPPSHLPHESDYSHENELVPPPPTASGYHTHFRRGILVPVYPTLQSQLTAIAKEYALPSTVGLVLYLINTSPDANANMRLGVMAEEDKDPGPRLSEDIWRHIWARVLKAERDETPLTSARANGLGFGMAAQSSPSLLQDMMSNPSPLRPLLSPMRTEAPRLGTPSPSTTASHSAISSRSGLDSPDSATSVSDADNISLPGLSSSALIPILAKVEFDVDKRKATWYGRWKKTRRAQHAKRAESRLGFRQRAGSRAGDESALDGEDDEAERKPALELHLVERLQAEANTPAHLRAKNGRLLPPGGDDEYAQLPDSDSDGEGDEEETMKYGQGRVSGDPLADVFGTDAETWADMRAEPRPLQKGQNPNVVDLALDGAALAALPDPSKDSDEQDPEDDAAEVADLLKRNSRPQLSVAIPGGSPPKSANHRTRSGSQGSSLSRKKIPPALDLAPSLPNAVPTAAPGTDGLNLRLAYLTEESSPSTGTDDEDEFDGSLKPRRSPLDEKRDGQFFDDLNLGLEGSMEYDEDDPDDRRKSQVLMMAKLDEIEKALAQFSPRKLAIEDLAAETPTGMPTIASLTPTPSHLGVPPTPRPSPNPGPPTEGASWPAVPYSVLNSMQSSSPEFEPMDGIPEPPRIAFNGISTELPKSPFQKRFANVSDRDSISHETLVYKRELEAEQDVLYPPLVAPSLVRTPGSDSPVIPLSPDPFGRFPSEHDIPPPRIEHAPSLKKVSRLRQEVPHGKSLSNASLDAPSSSRFSIDSLASEEGGKSQKAPSLMSVKSIKKLWRRTNKASIPGSASPSIPSLPSSGRSSPNTVPNMAPNSAPAMNGGVQTGNRTSRTLSRSPQPPESARSTPSPAMLMPKRKGSMHQMQWNQETPYPVHPPRQPSPAVPPMPASSPPPPPVSAPAAPVQSDGKVGTRKSILKSFRGQPGTNSMHSSSSSISTSRQSNEQRRPGVVELSSVMKRASGVSSTMTLVDIPRNSSSTIGEFQVPRSPPPPGSQSRSASRQSQLSLSSGRQQRPSISSNDSSSSRAPSRLLSSPPRKGYAPSTSPTPSGLAVPRTSAESSYEDRPSFDESQFEMVSPQHSPAHMLSYPYNTMDQSMSSAE